MEYTQTIQVNIIKIIRIQEATRIPISVTPVKFIIYIEGTRKNSLRQ